MDRFIVSGRTYIKQNFTPQKKIKPTDMTLTEAKKKRQQEIKAAADLRREIGKQNKKLNGKARTQARNAQRDKRVATFEEPF
jgi:hypothetical protein